MKQWLTLVLLLMVFIFSRPILAGGDFFMVTDIGSSAGMIRQANIEGFSPLASTVFDNPAGLYRTNTFSASAFTTTFMDEVTYKNVAVATKLPIGVLGLGYMTAGVTGIPYTFENTFGNTDPTFTDTEFDVSRYFDYNNTMAKVSYELSQTEHLHFGGSLVYYSTSLDTYTGRGFNFDAGLILESKPLSLSIMARNVVPSLKVNYSNGQSENLPLQTSYAARYQLGEADILAQLRTDSGYQKFMKAFAIDYHPNFLPFMSFSAGYKEFPVIRDIKSNFTLGVGLHVFDLSFDYAYERSDHIEYNNKHYFSVGISY